MNSEDIPPLACGRLLNRQQKRDLIAARLLADPAVNDNQLGELLGVSKNTVAAVRGQLETTRQIDKLTQFRGRDDKVRPRQYRHSNATPQPAHASISLEPEEKTVAAQDSLGTYRVETGNLDVRTAARTPKEAVLRAIEEAEGGTALGAVIKVYGDHGRWYFGTLYLLEQSGIAIA